MTHKLIRTPNYLLVVDDSEIKEGGFVLVSCSELNIIETRKVKDYYNEQFLFDGGGQIHMDYCKKIIAHLPLNDSPILEGVDLLPLLEQTRYDFAKMFYDILKATYPTFDEWIEAKEYNKAREKYKYTEDDMRKAIFLYAGWITGGMPSLKVAKTAEERLEQIFQSLSQPKMPVAFDCDVKSFEQEYRIPIREVRITTTEGHTQWVGKYIY